MKRDISQIYKYTNSFPMNDWNKNFTTLEKEINGILNKPKSPAIILERIIWPPVKFAKTLKLGKV